MQTTTNFEHLRERAINAHRWTSFSPERRGETLIKEFSEQLNFDIDFLSKKNIESETIESYKIKFERLLCSWINAKSNCASTMITGGSNFNVRKAEKANRSEQRHYEIFAEWRERAKKAIVRKAQPKKTYSSELERYKSELAAMQKNHELMKEGNKAIKAAHKEGKDISQYLKDTFGIKDHMIDWTIKFGFGLANNNANMKRVEERIKILEQKETIATTTGNKETVFYGFKVIQNFEIDRLQIIFEERKDKAICEMLKKHGFKYAPSQSAWQRQLTGNAMFSLKHYVIPILNHTNATA